MPAVALSLRGYGEIGSGPSGAPGRDAADAPRAGSGIHRRGVGDRLRRLPEAGACAESIFQSNEIHKVFIPPVGLPASGIRGGAADPQTATGAAILPCDL